MKIAWILLTIDLVDQVPGGSKHAKPYQSLRQLTDYVDLPEKLPEDDERPPSPPPPVQQQITDVSDKLEKWGDDNYWGDDSRNKQIVKLESRLEEVANE